MSDGICDPLDRSTIERRIEGTKMKTSVDVSSDISNSVFSVGEYKKRASFTIVFVISRFFGSRRTTDSSEERILFSLFFFSFRFRSSQDHSLLVLPLPLSSRGSRERRSIINDMRHPGSRNIKYSRAFMTGPVGKRGRRVGPDRWALGPSGGKKIKKNVSGQKKKGRACEGSGCSPPSTNL